MKQSELFLFKSSRIPVTKSEQTNLSEAFVSAVQNGDINPIDAVVQMKSIAETIGIFLKDNRIREAVLKECAKYGKGENPAFHGAVVQQKETGVSYDFMVCADPVWTDLMAREQEIADQRKEREKYLRTITKPKPEIDESTGEVYTIKPPARSSTTTYAITFKKG